MKGIRNIRASYDSFRDLIESGSYYVDKTEVIKEFLVDKFDKAVLFARPRRFGKTLTMTMFREFLDISRDSRKIFGGLKIMDYPELVEDYMNKYPVIFVSFKEVYGDDTESVVRSFRNVVSNLCKNYTYLLKSDMVDDADKVLLDNLRCRRGEIEDIAEFLDLISRMLYYHYGKKVFVIIDEYDVPMAKTMGTSAYEKTRDIIEMMLSFVCKTNENVKAVMLSGCLYTVKNSTYTGVNNIIPYTIMSPNFASSIGFTDGDVKAILKDLDYEDYYGVIKDWYDGYIFGRERMYCPWDVLRFLRSLSDGSYSEQKGPESYWLNSSETSIDIIRGFLGKAVGVMEKFEQLLAGKEIICTVNDNLPYHRIHENGDNIWSALLETGYLTKAVEEGMPRMPLRIPNKEIQEVFRKEVWEFFNGKIDNNYLAEFEKAIWKKDISKAEQNLSMILEATLSFYHEYREYSYHLILDGLFTGLGYRVLSETETGYGRSDLIILDSVKKRCLIIELKHVNDENDIKGALQEANSQIIRNKYNSMLAYDGYVEISCFGMAFWKKRCMISNI